MFIPSVLKEYYRAWKQVHLLRRRSGGAVIPFSTRLHSAEGIRLSEGVNLGPEVQLLAYPGSWNLGQGSIVLKEKVKVGARVQLFAGSGYIEAAAGTDIGHGAQLMAQRLDTTSNEAHAVPGSIHIGPSCWIGAGAILLADTSLGEHCVVAAGAVVQGHYPGFTTLVGNPARPMPRSNV